MNLFRNLARDSLWLLIARLGVQVSIVIVTYLLARRLGTAGFGEYAFLASAIVIGNVFTTFGSDMVLIREIAAKDDLSDVPQVLFLQLVLSSLFIGAVFLFASSLPNQTPDGILALKVYSLALFPLAFFTVFTSILRGTQRMTAYAHLNLLTGLLQVAAVFLFIQRGINVVRLAFLLLGIHAAGAVLAGLYCSAILASYWKSLHFSTHGFRTLLGNCLFVAAIAFLMILHQKTSIAMLSLMSAASMVGVFSAAARVIEAARVGHIAALTALYPALANAHRDKVTCKIFGMAWFLFLVVSTGASVLLFLLAAPIVDIFFGREYGSSITVLRILAFTLIPYTVNSFLSTILLAQKQEKIVLRVLGVSLATLLTLNFILVPMMGEVGAGWATLSTEIAQSVLFLLAWAGVPLRRMDALFPKGVPHEFSDSP